MTGVPLLLNTSFNLAGEPIVETPEDAIEAIKESTIHYLYLPEINMLVENQNAK
jgi:carbamoyltransferase